METQQVDKLITQQQLVELTGLSKQYFEGARHRGDSALAYVKFGRAVRYRMSDVALWISSNVIGAGI